MIAELIANQVHPERVLEAVAQRDMTAEVDRLIETLHVQHSGLNDTNTRRAAILDIVNPQTHNLTLHCTDFGNISLKAPQAPTSAELYSVPGHTILFAIHRQPFLVQLYRVTEDKLLMDERVTIYAGHPLWIDGRHFLFDVDTSSHSQQAFIGSINLPDRSADISVYDRDTLRKIAWFPHDDGAARHLVSLQLLEGAEDPGGAKVAEELIYHYHPAVAWHAFQILYQQNRQAALEYVPLLRQLKSQRLDYLLESLH